MNAELIRAGYARIVIPTVLRNEYLSGLSGLSGLTGLTHNGRPDGLVTVLDFAQRYTSQVDFSSLDIATRMLAATNALEDSSTAAENGKRIVLPGSLPLGWEYAKALYSSGASAWMTREMSSTVWADTAPAGNDEGAQPGRMDAIVARSLRGGGLDTALAGLLNPQNSTRRANQPGGSALPQS